MNSDQKDDHYQLKCMSMSLNDRSFNIQDVELIQHAEVMAATLPNEIDKFTAFDNTITIDYPAKIQDALAQYNTIRPDMLIVNEQAELTLIVNNALAECNTAFKTISFFVRKAFINNNAIRNQFGFNKIEKVRHSQTKLIPFMETLADTALKYKTNLMEAGCNESIIDSIHPLAEHLKVANIAQEKAKNERSVISQDRVNSLNTIYQLLKPIHEIAQIIYTDDQAQLSKYSLPKPKSSNNNADDIIQS
jgi:hypothetical protein